MAGFRPLLTKAKEARLGDEKDQRMGIGGRAEAPRTGECKLWGLGLIVSSSA